MKSLMILFISALIMTTTAQAEEKLMAEIKTNKGVIVLELYGNEAPLTVASFVNLIQRGYYDGIIFHRVINDFMIQTGDPTGTGRGGPGYSFEDEVRTGLKHNSEGILSMANSGPSTNGSQFFITHVPTSWLNGKHTVFGKVVLGMDVVNSIVKGDKMVEVKITGDVPEKVKAQQKRVDEWNVILDQKFGEKLKPAVKL